MTKLLVCLILVLGILSHHVACQKTIGFVFSGGGSRIAQEIALMESLSTGDYFEGKPLRPSFVSGSSAGSLCAVGLGAILKTQEGFSSNPYTWTDLKNLLFNLKPGDVFDDSPLGIYNILNYNIYEGFFLDTTPLRATLTKELKRMGFWYMKDLYLPTCISVVEEDTGLPIPICSDDPNMGNLQLIDVLMSSTAMPVIFPHQHIPGLNLTFGNGTFIDGGVGTDMVPVRSAYQRELDEVYIMTRQLEVNSKKQLPGALKKIKLLANVVSTFDTLLQAAFLSGLSQASTSKIPSYAYVPILPVDFGLLDFDKGQLMYEMTKNWTRTNSPYCLNAC